jgi:putative transposase
MSVLGSRIPEVVLAHSVRPCLSSCSVFAITMWICLCRPNELWVTDCTHVPTWSGFVITALVIDVCSPMIVGWRTAASMTTPLVMDALDMAIFSRRHQYLDGVIAHSDAGAQYMSVAYTERLAEIGARPSIGGIGDSYDNSLAESVNGLYKTELIRRQGPWRNVEHVELATLAWVDWFNNRRLHSELGDIPPAEFEHDYYARTRSHQQTPTPTRT